jgi:hypothetical protein
MLLATQMEIKYEDPRRRPQEGRRLPVEQQRTPVSGFTALMANGGLGNEFVGVGDADLRRTRGMGTKPTGGRNCESGQSQTAKREGREPEILHGLLLVHGRHILVAVGLARTRTSRGEQLECQSGRVVDAFVAPNARKIRSKRRLRFHDTLHRPPRRTQSESPKLQKTRRKTYKGGRDPCHTFLLDVRDFIQFIQHMHRSLNEMTSERHVAPLVDE